jgi:predicted dehydrogenase
VNFGIIGSAHSHIYEIIEAFIASEGKFMGIYNDGSDLAIEISSRYSVPLFDDINELFALGIEVAGTSAINNKKIDIIVLCAKNNVHIMADKPIVINEQQYLRLENVIKNSGIQVGLMLSVRFLPAVYTLKKLIDSGVIGKLLSVEIFNPHKLNAPTRPEWHFDKKQNGGIAIDLHVHSIDTFNWLTGSKITEYSGTMIKSVLAEKPDFYDASQFMVHTDAGVTGYFRVDWHTPDMHWSWGDIRIFCTGSKGQIEVRASGDPITKQKQVILYGIDSETQNIEMEDPNCNETVDFINRIKGKKHIITHHDILEATRLSIEFDKCAKLYRIDGL